MIRQPYAAVVLQDQIKATFRNAKVETTGQIDGFGVRRSLVVSGKATARRLLQVLEIVDDSRVADLHMSPDESLLITFVAGPQADDRREFPLAAVIAVLEGDA